MDTEQMGEWLDSLRSVVPERLRDASYLGITGLHIGQLLILPSFENSVSWDVTETRGKKSEPRLYRTCWRMDIDQEAFRSPVERLRHTSPYPPTVEVGWCRLDPGRLDALLKKLRTTPIPLDVADARLGCDGTSYELALGRYFCTSRIHWWERMPEAWRPLEPIVEEMLGLFEATWNGGPRHSIDREVMP